MNNGEVYIGKNVLVMVRSSEETKFKIPKMRFRRRHFKRYKKILEKAFES